MTTVTRSTFVHSLKYGVDLDKPGLATSLQGTGVSIDQLRQADTNHDGRLRGRELHRAFAQVDSLDRDGSRRSFSAQGKAAKLYNALLDARRPGPYHGLAVAKVAISLVASRGEQYAKDAAPVSENPRLSHNTSPGRTPLTWLAGRNKCNQFVGDALWRAGMKAPSYAMPDGSRHYVNAEALPAQRSCFDRIPRVKDLRVGDMIVIDLPGSGRDSAHAEIITHLDRRRGIIRTTGAHADGAYESSGSRILGQSWSSALNKATYDGEGQRWTLGGLQLYLLRPTLGRKPSNGS